jgi:2'-5' RNA ligase
MKLLILVLILSFQINAQAKCDYKTSNGVVSKFVNYQGASTEITIKNEIEPLAFIYKNKDGCFGKYVTLDLDFSEVKNVFDQLNRKIGNLKNRGEAHITLLTPPEYQHFFGNYGISMATIEQVIKESFSAQNIRYEITGLGSGHIEELSTYFLIVESQDLKALRERLAELLPSKVRTEFLETGFYPHITLGFNKRDLHISQGIRKDLEFSNDRRFLLRY